MAARPAGVLGVLGALAGYVRDGLLDVLWPARCPLCDGWLSPDEPGARAAAGPMGPAMHVRCFRALPRASLVPAAPRPLREGVPVRWCFADAPQLFALLHAAKYGGQPGLLRPLGRALAAAARAAHWIPAGSVIVPLPDDPVRLRERGYSPTGLVAREVARGTRCRVRGDLLRRTRCAAPQARQRDDGSRRANVADLFGVGRLAELPRQIPLVLVDDQITSGATLATAARILGARGNPLLCMALAGASRAPGEVGLDTPARRSLELSRRG